MGIDQRVSKYPNVNDNLYLRTRRSRGNDNTTVRRRKRRWKAREKGEDRETTKSENVSFDGHDDLVPTHHWWTGYEINTKQTAILSPYRIYVRIRKGVLMCHGVWISESHVTRVTASVYTLARIHAERGRSARACACTHVSMRKAADVCVKIDYTAGENVINSSTNKGLRRLYNANSKNRGGLRELRR